MQICVMDEQQSGSLQRQEKKGDGEYIIIGETKE
jgi:hypothetical protein